MSVYRLEETSQYSHHPSTKPASAKLRRTIEYDRQAKATDLAFFLRRQDPDIKSSWTVFNQSLSSEER